MEEGEDDGLPVLQLVVIDKLWPSSSTEIGDGRLVGDLNRVAGSGMSAWLNDDLELSIVLHSSEDMLQEAISCPAWDVLSKIIRKQQLVPIDIAHIVWTK